MAAMAERKTFLRRVNNLSSKNELIESAASLDCTDSTKTEAVPEMQPVPDEKENVGRWEDSTVDTCRYCMSRK